MAVVYGISLDVSFFFESPTGVNIDLLSIPLIPMKPSKYHANVLKTLFTTNELSICLVEKSTSDRPLSDSERLNLLKGTFINFYFYCN